MLDRQTDRNIKQDSQLVGESFRKFTAKKWGISKSSMSGLVPVSDGLHNRVNI